MYLEEDNVSILEVGRMKTKDKMCILEVGRMKTKDNMCSLEKIRSECFLLI